MLFMEMASMLNLKRMMIDSCMENITETYRRTYPDAEEAFGDILKWSEDLALEEISNSDALYHDVGHTLMVTFAGQAVLHGKHLAEGDVTPRDWVHFMIALLFHDIGYIRGICKGDNNPIFVTGVGEETIELLPGSTDAALGPYHIDRGKRVVKEQFGKGLPKHMPDIIDPDLISYYIEMTRFPVPDGDSYQDTKGYPGLIRAADFIGQLGDPDRLRKCPALFYEFEELGLNERLGYRSPQDLRRGNASFYWDVVHPYVQDALRYLHVTEEGRQWIANLQANVGGTWEEKGTQS